MALQTPSALIRSLPSVNEVVRIDSAAGVIIAAPSPWENPGGDHHGIAPREPGGQGGQREQGGSRDQQPTTPGADRGEPAAAFAAVRSRLGVVAVVLAVAGIAWWATAARMAGMDAGPGTSLGTLGWFAGVWTVMMAAMMLPSLAPTAAICATLTRRRESSRWLLFAGGYLFVWSATGVLAYGLFTLGQNLLATDLRWQTGGRWLAAAVLITAALYELTPAKEACLRWCRSPQRVLPATWREGRSGACAMGAHSGGWYLGCTWALMAALFALGVMSLTWMALVATLVALEKLGTRPRAATIAAAVLLIALALAILTIPHDIPGLIVPDSNGALMR